MKQLNTKTLVILLSTFFIFTVCPGAHGQGRDAEDHGWSFTLAPYLWLSGIDGDLKVRGNETTIDADFGDIMDYFDFGTQIHFEAWKDDMWGIFVDPTFIKFSSDAKVRSATIELEEDYFLFEFGGFYRLMDKPVGSSEDRIMSLEALFGGRYTDLAATLGFKDGPNVEGDKDWFDLFIGARLRADVSTKLDLMLRTDVGGFGMGSDFTWTVSGLLGYHFNPAIAAWFGYKAQGVDYDEGTGDKQFMYDVIMHGPILGIGFSF
jgi:hypothetical protein